MKNIPWKEIATITAAIVGIITVYNLLSGHAVVAFVAGAAVGVGGTLLWRREDGAGQVD